MEGRCDADSRSCLRHAITGSDSLVGGALGWTMPAGRARGAAPELEVRLAEGTVPARCAGSALVEATLQDEFGEGTGRYPDAGLQIGVEGGVLRKKPGLTNRMVHPAIY
jgi:hypothetical protein